MFFTPRFLAGTDMESMDSGSQALAVRYIQKPQDGHADTVAKLSFSPSFVTYNPVVIENVQAFFKTGEVSADCFAYPSQMIDAARGCEICYWLNYGARIASTCLN